MVLTNVFVCEASEQWFIHSVTLPAERQTSMNKTKAGHQKCKERAEKMNKWMKVDKYLFFFFQKKGEQ